MQVDALTRAIESGVPLLVLSPHLHDAALPCGALIMDSVDRTSVTVATMFTEAGDPPYTLSARRYLHQVGARNAHALYQDRKAEDRAALEPVGVTCVHVGLTEALFRRRPDRSYQSRLARGLPELVHIYPTYRRHISRGQIATTDSRTLNDVGDAIRRLTRAGPSVLLAPLGVGRHVDHVLVRDAAEQSGAKVVHYSDFPYNQSNSPDQEFTSWHGLTELHWTRRIEAKIDLVRIYKTQTGALFDGSHIPVAPEVFYFDPDSTKMSWPSGAQDTAEVQN